MASKVASSRAQNKRKTSVATTTVESSEEVVFMAYDPNDFMMEEYLVSKPPKSRKSRWRKKTKKSQNSNNSNANADVSNNMKEEGQTMDTKKEKRSMKFDDGNEQVQNFIEEEELCECLSRRMSRKMSGPPSPDFTPLQPIRLSFNNTINTPSVFSPEYPNEP